MQQCPFVHPPAAMVAVLNETGLDICYQHRGRSWQVVALDRWGASASGWLDVGGDARVVQDAGHVVKRPRRRGAVRLDGLLVPAYSLL
ncbi:MAG: hypothetical protein M3423_01245 [Actinomycetota bacterium]|nr:hypothetical protein [Actinomycetota bacterium]